MRQTQENVAELMVALCAKLTELRQKDKLANDKLQQMVGDQNEAEKRKDEVERTSIEVEKQNQKITSRKEEAQSELDQAEPALLSAQAAVKGIKRRDLDEIRALPRPSPNVKATLECVAIMLGEKNLEWTNVRKLISKSDFIPSILNFVADTLSAKQVNLVTSRYLDGNDSLDYKTVMNSSKACGPLYKWAESQVKYSSVFNRVQPLREEVIRLERESITAIEHKQKLETEVQELETSIEQYKADYATLIRDV